MRRYPICETCGGKYVRTRKEQTKCLKCWKLSNPEEVNEANYPFKIISTTLPSTAK